MTTGLLDDPDDLLDSIGTFSQRESASFRDEAVCICRLELTDNVGVRLIVGNQDDVEAVEGAGCDMLARTVMTT